MNCGVWTNVKFHWVHTMAGKYWTANCFYVFVTKHKISIFTFSFCKKLVLARHMLAPLSGTIWSSISELFLYGEIVVDTNFACVIGWWKFIDMMIVIISDMCDQYICRLGFFLSTNRNKMVLSFWVLTYCSPSWIFDWFIICTFLTMGSGTTARAWVGWLFGVTFCFQYDEDDHKACTLEGCCKWVWSCCATSEALACLNMLGSNCRWLTFADMSVWIVSLNKLLMSWSLTCCSWMSCWKFRQANLQCGTIDFKQTKNSCTGPVSDWWNHSDLKCNRCTVGLGFLVSICSKVSKSWVSFKSKNLWQCI